MNNSNYEAVYKNTGLTPRKLNRPEDAVAIHIGKHEDRTVEVVKDFLVIMTILGSMALLISVVVYGY